LPMASKGLVIVPDDETLTVFTDGSSLPSPRRGGIGIRFIYSGRDGTEISWDRSEVGVVGATNNQMELLAVVTAMRAIQSPRFRTDLLAAARKIDIYTDSQYVVNNISNACYVWPRQHWMTREGAPVQNADLWKDLVRELVKLRRLKPVTIEWGQGHSADNPHNKAVDKLAKRSATYATRPPLNPTSVRRKKTQNATEIGSVEMLGQRLTIRIISAEYLRTQRIHKYRFEVMSRRSPFFGKVDIAYSHDPLMRPGHTYRVTMNKDQNNPMIAKRHAEVGEPT
jgi:ribonuclease HI